MAGGKFEQVLQIWGQSSCDTRNGDGDGAGGAGSSSAGASRSLEPGQGLWLCQCTFSKKRHLQPLRLHCFSAVACWASSAQQMHGVAWEVALPLFSRPLGTSGVEREAGVVL